MWLVRASLPTQTPAACASSFSIAQSLAARAFMHCRRRSFNCAVLVRSAQAAVMREFLQRQADGRGAPGRHRKELAHVLLLSAWLKANDFGPGRGKVQLTCSVRGWPPELLVDQPVDVAAVGIGMRNIIEQAPDLGERHVERAAVADDG